MVTQQLVHAVPEQLQAQLRCFLKATVEVHDEIGAQTSPAANHSAASATLGNARAAEQQKKKKVLKHPQIHQLGENEKEINIREVQEE